jgi:hypothetical protein
MANVKVKLTIKLYLMSMLAINKFNHKKRLTIKKVDNKKGLFFDLSAAFDTIDTELLVKKLEVLGAASNMTTWVRSYLTGRRQRVDWDGCSSEMIDITVVSPQGQ